MITPKKITLLRTSTHLHLVVSAPECQKGYTVIDGTPISNGGPKPKTLASLRKHAQQYAKRWNIQFVDKA
jgi:hypothetical protein